jgi:subtilisin family serine protease
MGTKTPQLSLGLCALFLALSVTVAWSMASSRYLVSFRDDTPVTTQNDIVAASGGTVVKRFPLLNTVVITIPTDRLEAALDTLRRHSEVESIERDTSISAQGMAAGGIAGSLVTTESDPPLVRGGYTWPLLQIDLDRLRSHRLDGNGVGVAVVDTGVDIEHPALLHAVAGCYNALSSEAQGAEDPDDCADRNGHGTHMAGIIAAEEESPYQPQVMRGIAPGVRLYAVRVLNDDGSGLLSNLLAGLLWVYKHPDIDLINMSLGFYDGSNILHKCIKMLHEAGVVMVAAAGNYDVVAASEGGESEGGESLVASSEGGESEGGESEGGESEGGESTSGDSACIVVDVKYPAKYRETIAVAATDIDENIAYYSVEGSQVDMAAPGGTRSEPVISTTTTLDATILNQVAASEGGESEGGESLVASSEGGESEGGESEGGESEGGESEGGESTYNKFAGLYGSASGTSQATAHVTGVVALMLQINPNLKPDEVRTLLQQGALDLGVSAAAQGAGLINALHAVRGALRTHLHQ